MDVEQGLIDLFSEHNKCDHKKLHSGGGESDDYINYWSYAKLNLGKLRDQLKLLGITHSKKIRRNL